MLCTGVSCKKRFIISIASITMTVQKQRSLFYLYNYAQLERSGQPYATQQLQLAAAASLLGSEMMAQSKKGTRSFLSPRHRNIKWQENNENALSRIK